MDATRANLDRVELQDLAFNLMEQDEINCCMTIFPSMRNNTPIGGIMGVDKITTTSTACGAYGDYKDPFDEALKVVDFSMFDFRSKVCPISLRNNILMQGNQPDKFDASQMAAVVSGLAQGGAARDMMRLAWLGNTSATAATFNVAADVDNYNLKNGFYTQAVAAVAAGTMKKVTHVDTKAAENVLSALQQINAAGRRSAEIFATSGIYNELYLAAIGNASNGALVNYVDGIAELRVHGHKVVHLEAVSEMLAADYDTPFDFAIVSPKSNLAVPMDRADIAPSSWWFDGRTKEFLLNGEYQADFKIAVDAMAVLIAK